MGVTDGSTNGDGVLLAFIVMLSTLKRADLAKVVQSFVQVTLYLKGCSSD